MSDGYCEAVAEYEERFDEWMSELIYDIQYPITPKVFRAEMQARKAEKSQAEMSAFFSHASISILRGLGFREESVMHFFIYKCKTGQRFSVEELFQIFHDSRRMSKFICLQKATDYLRKLIIFTDSKWRVLTGNAVYYCHPMPFVNGDQDVLLGIAKKAHESDLRKGVPFMIVASRHFTRKRWHLDRVYQIPAIVA